jgi:hypothetical protein
MREPAVQDEAVVLVSSTIDLKSMEVEESYKGPRMQGGWSNQQARCAHKLQC